MELPETAGLQLERTDFAPDGHRAALFGLKLTNAGASAKTVTVKVDAHSELLAEYPWSFGNVPNASDQLPDTAAFDGDALVFREQGQASEHPNATEHDYAALVASDRNPVAGETGALGERVPRTAGHERLHRPGAAEPVRRRSVRQGQGRPAALRDHGAR